MPAFQLLPYDDLLLEAILLQNADASLSGVVVGIADRLLGHSQVSALPQVLLPRFLEQGTHTRCAGEAVCACATRGEPKNLVNALLERSCALVFVETSNMLLSPCRSTPMAVDLSRLKSFDFFPRALCRCLISRALYDRIDPG